MQPIFGFYTAWIWVLIASLALLSGCWSLLRYFEWVPFDWYSAAGPSIDAANRRFFRLKYGPWGLIAGASEGIGAEFSVALAQRGFNLILVARRAKNLSCLANDLKRNYHIEVEEWALDLDDRESIRNRLLHLGHEIGLLVYNAAYSPIGYFQDLAEQDLEKIVSVNIRTPLLLLNALIKPMIERKKGGVILMSSLSGVQGSPKIATYAATKSFNTILAEGLWHELKRQHVDVLACVPGAVKTPGYYSANHKDAPGIMVPQQVVKEALDALGSRPVVTPGSFNRFANFVMSRLLPRKTAISIMHNNTKHLHTKQFGFH